MEPAILLHNVSLAFREGHKRLTVLEDINLSIRHGEFFVCIGPSGSGKSTLLRIMSGLERGYRGTVKYGSGIDARDIAFVFQQFALLPWLTVYENVELGLLKRIPDPLKRRKKITEELKYFGLDAFANSRPRELSGGMRQRVGIARALVIDPKIIFMDEPFSELDSFIASGLRKDLLAVWKERNVTIIFVTHIIEEAVELASRVAVLTPRPGRIEKIVENDLPRPRIERSESFYQLEDELFTIIKP